MILTIVLTVIIILLVLFVVVLLGHKDNLDAFENKLRYHGEWYDFEQPIHMKKKESDTIGTPSPIRDHVLVSAVCLRKFERQKVFFVWPNTLVLTDPWNREIQSYNFKDQIDLGIGDMPDSILQLNKLPKYS